MKLKPENLQPAPERTVEEEEAWEELEAWEEADDIDLTDYYNEVMDNE